MEEVAKGRRSVKSLKDDKFRNCLLSVLAVNFTAIQKTKRVSSLS